MADPTQPGSKIFDPDPSRVCRAVFWRVCAIGMVMNVWKQSDNLPNQEKKQ